MGFFVKVMLLHLVERDITIFIFPSVWAVHRCEHMAVEQFRLGGDAGTLFSGVSCCKIVSVIDWMYLWLNS